MNILHLEYLHAIVVAGMVVCASSMSIGGELVINKSSSDIPSSELIITQLCTPPPSTIGEWNFGFYRRVALPQGWICTNKAHLGHKEVSVIEGVSLREVIEIKILIVKNIIVQ